MSNLQCELTRVLGGESSSYSSIRFLLIDRGFKNIFLDSKKITVPIFHTEKKNIEGCVDE